MESAMPNPEQIHSDSGEVVEGVMLGGLGGFTLHSVFYFHLNPWEAEVEVIGLTILKKSTIQPFKDYYGNKSSR